MVMLLGHRVPSPCLSLLFSFPAGRSFARFALASARASQRRPLHRLGRLVRTRTQLTSHNATHPHRLSHFVFPDCESSPRCAADLVFYRCMKMNPLAPPAAGPFFMHSVLCATGAASAALSGSQLAGNGCRVGKEAQAQTCLVLFDASSPGEHQHDDEAGGENCGLQIQCQREVGGATEELEKSAHPAVRSCRWLWGCPRLERGLRRDRVQT